MFRLDSEEDAAFRAEVRAWLEENLDEELRDQTIRMDPEKLIPWHKLLRDKGWIAPHWPKENGGMGASLSQQIIMNEEMGRIGAPQLCTVHGLNHLGPILIEFGTEEQKAKYLPPIIEGDIIWAEGYSEPNSGSDLASLRTKAERVGDEYIVNGQKIWTTFGHYSDWIFCLVRTDPDAKPKQAGIGFLLFDLKSPGVTVRPITTIAGDDEFSECFFEDVHVPAENMVGDAGEGWRIANAVLMHERFNSGNPYLNFKALERVHKVARATGAMDDPAFRDRLADLEIRAVAFSALFDHAVELTRAERPPGPAASIMKINGKETLMEIACLLFEAAGAQAPGTALVDTPEGPIDVADIFLMTRHESIRGGTSEIMRNIVAKRGLGLPS
jgi:alkylation response protein AidB-like acyl-CoA dehydrogenase